MKINTDGVLLGAMATARHPQRILDVGTGTGVISLMLAQRFPAVVIDAIEIDAKAADTARRNFEASPFSGRISCHPVSLGDFEPRAPYDLIVSNPPFFLRSLTNDDCRKRVARHTDMMFFDQLLGQSKRWLSPKGRLELVVPIPLAELIGQKAAEDYTLAVRGATSIRSFPSHPPIRRIISVGDPAGLRSCSTDDFVIYERRGVYSSAYRELLRAFFLAF